MDSGVIYLALLHHPVRNRGGQVITAALTNLDVHDIARAARTYGVKAYYLVTPVAGQQALARSLVAHWLEGRGGEVNPDRREALCLVRLARDLNEVCREVLAETGQRPRLIATTALGEGASIGWSALRKMFQDEKGPTVLLFGTASGLDQSVLSEADAILEPIHGRGAYNHLSVRSAVAVALDRLLGTRD